MGKAHRERRTEQNFFLRRLAFHSASHISCHPFLLLLSASSTHAVCCEATQLVASMTHDNSRSSGALSSWLQSASLNSDATSSTRTTRALYRVHRLLQHVQPSPFASCRAARTVSCAANEAVAAAPPDAATSASVVSVSTADLCDSHSSELLLLPAQWRSFGARTRCCGPVHTLRTFEDNGMVRATLETAGRGRVLLVDGGGSMRCALVGDQLAQLAVKNGWAGVIVYGAIRDVAEIRRMPLCLLALGSSPVRSVRRGWGVAGQPINIGAAAPVCDGDWCYADEDGVVIAKRPLHLDKSKDSK